MTMRLDVTNTDTMRSARVYYEARAADGSWRREDAPVAIVAPGDKFSAWIHSSRRVVLEEIVGSEPAS